MDANRIVSAAAQEAASVRELYTQLSQVEFDQRIQTDLRPFFHLIIPNWWISSKILTLPETADENAQ